MPYLVFIITNACNMNCKFCLRSRDRASLDLKLAEKILRQAKKLGYDRIGITGGEAYMHPKFYELVDMIAKEGFSFTIVSNGMHYEKYKPLLKYGKKFVGITFSLDAGEEKVHDMFRGKGSFRRVCSAVRFFIKRGMRVRTQICLHKFNLGQIEKFTELSERLKVDNCQFLSVIPGRGNQFLVLSDEEKNACVRRINRLREQKFFPLRIMSSLCGGIGINFCNALELTDAAVNPNGQLIFCCDTIGNGAVLGSLKREPLAKLLKKGRTVSMFLKKKRKEHFAKREFFAGFNTCVFCNKYLNCGKK